MTVIYRDRWTKIIGSMVASLVVDSMGRTDSFFQRMATGNFYIDLFAGFLITLILWELIKGITVSLDKKYGWFDKPLQRFLLQFVWGVFVPILLSFGIALTYMRLVWKQDIFNTEWLYNEIYMVVFIILIVNFTYFSWWLFLKYSESVSHNSMATHSLPFTGTTSQAHKESVIHVTKAGKTILLPSNEIAHIYLVQGYTYLQKFDGEDFVSTLSLEEFSSLLDKDRFFRTNRQIIVQRKACLSFQNIENGKIEVEVVPKMTHRVIVSQKRAKEFRKWITHKG